LDVKKRFSEEQIIGFLRKAERALAVEDLSATRVLGGQLHYRTGMGRLQDCRRW
jgi:hypothetical protein